MTYKDVLSKLSEFNGLVDGRPITFPAFKNISTISMYRGNKIVAIGVLNKGVAVFKNCASDTDKDIDILRNAYQKYVKIVLGDLKVIFCRKIPK